MTLSSRDPVLVARAARRLIQSGHWRSQIGRDDKAKILVSLHSRLPFAVGHLPLDALVALAKKPPAGGCAWCSALVQRVPDKPELERNETTVALLGEPCARCRRRHLAAEVAQRERGHLDQLAAAGLSPMVFRHLRTSGQVLAHAAEMHLLRATRAAATSPSTGRRRGRGPAPTAATGFLWAVPGRR
jgi:hypothetical protein